MNFSTLLTVADASARSRAGGGRGFTEAQFRWWIANRNFNGFSRCIVQVGRRVYIDPDQFNDWLSKNNGARVAPARVQAT